MKYLITMLIFPLAIFLSSASCKKASSEIANGFACKIDGKSWRPYSDDFKLSETECQITQNGESIFIKARNTRSREHFSILVNSPGKIVVEGKYPLNSDRYFWGSYDDLGYSGDFITGNGYEGELEIIKVDKVKLRIVGKFHFTCYNEKTKESRTITEGNFNLLYHIY